MNKVPIYLHALLLIVCLPAVAQKKLKKADRTIVNNLNTHVSYLKSDKLGGRKAGTDGEKLAGEYIVKQFAKSGLKPRGEKEWSQAFEIYDGREVKPSSKFTLNDKELVLYEDYFPLAFSANKTTEAAVAIALAEDGVPWFKDIRELISGDDSVAVDTFAIIRKKAKHAADKGASALIIYNRSSDNDLSYNKYDRSEPLTIPVVFIKKDAFEKYASDESSILDVKLNVELEEKSRTGNNFIGYADNGADSIVIASANLDDELNVAALLEVARLMKANKNSKRNYLFVAYSGERNGEDGTNYFREHPSVNVEKVDESVSLDSLSTTVENPKGLNLVKRSVEIIKNN